MTLFPDVLKKHRRIRFFHRLWFGKMSRQAWECGLTVDSPAAVSCFVRVTGSKHFVTWGTKRHETHSQFEI